MEELRKVADTCIDMLTTESDCPSNHPELGYKMPILDMWVSIKEVKVSAPWMENGDINEQCQEEGTCLPIGSQNVQIEVEGLGGGPGPAQRMVPQIFFQFYRKPMAPNKVMLASSAQPWQQKRTTATQELIRRLLNTKKEMSCNHKQKILSEYMQLLKIQNMTVDLERRSSILVCQDITRSWRPTWKVLNLSTGVGNGRDLPKGWKSRKSGNLKIG